MNLVMLVTECDLYSYKYKVLVTDEDGKTLMFAHTHTKNEAIEQGEAAITNYIIHAREDYVGNYEPSEVEIIDSYCRS